MVTSLAIVAIVAQVPVQEASPLQTQAAALVATPSQVQYEFITQVVPNFGITLAQYVRLPADRRERIVLNAYYIMAVDRAQLLFRGDQGLYDILRGFQTGADGERVALQFEAAYREKFKTWPPMVPVDVEALVERMLRQRTIR